MRVYYIEGKLDVDGIVTLVQYTDDVTRAATFILHENGDYNEGSVASEEFLADPDDMPAPSGRVWYECNGEREGCRRKTCYKNPDNRWAPGTVCRKTRDIRAAKNFRADESGDYYECV